MKSFAQAIDLANEPGMIEDYERHHRAVWPEVVSALRALGIRRMKIYRVGSRLFMYFEAPNDFEPRRDFQTYTQNPRCQQWDEWMRAFQVRLADANGNDWWTPMEEVFDLECA